MAARRKWRWWVLAGALLLILGFLAWVWLAPEVMRQQRVIRTFMAVLAAGAIVVLWILVLSGFRWWRRLLLVVALAAVAGLVAAVLRVDGVSGDMVPIVSWRWSKPAGSAPAVSPAAGGTVAVDTPAGAADAPRFLGPGGLAVFEAPAPDWSGPPPRELWRRPCGPGWSSFAVGGGRAVTQVQDGEDELVVGWALGTGETLWVHRDRARYANPVAGTGPRATPAIDGGIVFAHGATGLLNALELETGRRLWSADVLAESRAGPLDWGQSASPLVVGDLVIVTTGRGGRHTLVARDRERGEIRWTAGHDDASFSSPALVELAGVRQVVVVNQRSVSGHDLDGGEILWEQAWPGETPKVAQPLPVGRDRILVSAGYGVGSLLLHVEQDDEDAWSVGLVWRSRRLKAKFTNLVARDGFAYGLDDGILACLDLATGERRWKSGRYGHGQVMLLGDRLLVQAESGELVLVEADPAGHREAGRTEALDGKTWNTPALAGRYLLVRNDREAVCLDLGRD